MQALELRDNPLQWETERQNRILQSAIDNKRQMSMENGRRRNPDSRAVPEEVQVSMEDWIDKLHRIPGMRSALIPFEDGANAEEWSKPFSLAKADIEPWVSFYKGYKQSRLFLEGQPDPERWPAPDHAVRALLELRQIPPKLIAEPPVQINRQVEYFDLEGELQANRDPARVRALLISAANVHEAELRKAADIGREMGNQLHDALLGDGHCNLISAWTRSFKRKPTIEELHLMLTTGRVKVSSERKPAQPATLPAAEPRPKSVEPRIEAVAESIVPVLRPEAPVQRPAPVRVEPAVIAKMVADTEPDDDDNEMPVKAETGISKRKIVWHLVQAVACCAALAGVIFYV